MQSARGTERTHLHLGSDQVRQTQVWPSAGMAENVVERPVVWVDHLPATDAEHPPIAPCDVALRAIDTDALALPVDRCRRSLILLSLVPIRCHSIPSFLSGWFG